MLNNHKSIILVGLMAVSPTWASHTGMRYDTDYAQDLAKCPQHFASGTPPVLVFDKSGKDQYPLCFRAFGLVYSGISKTAIYSAHHLTKTKISQARQMDREDNFRPETRLPRHLQVQNSDYKGYDYDRGHLVPNGDMPNRAEQYDSFSFANIIPQNQEHNRGVWREIESHTRNLAHRYGEAYVVTGVAFMGKTQTMNSVIVPSHLFKAVYIPSQNISAVYFSANNNSQNYELIDTTELQNRTGVIAFPAIDNARFEPRQFALDSRNDNNEQSATTNEKEELGGLIVKMVIAIWRAIFG